MTGPLWCRPPHSFWVTHPTKRDRCCFFGLTHRNYAFSLEDPKKPTSTHPSFSLAALTLPASINHNYITAVCIRTVPLQAVSWQPCMHSLYAVSAMILTNLCIVRAAPAFRWSATMPSGGLNHSSTRVGGQASLLFDLDLKPFR